MRRIFHGLIHTTNFVTYGTFVHGWRSQEACLSRRSITTDHISGLLAHTFFSNCASAVKLNRDGCLFGCLSWRTRRLQIPTTI